MGEVVETRRQQIEGVASMLFRQRGYAGTSVRDIARALDIQGASLYAHVESKEDVLWSIVARAAERFHGDVRPVVDARVPAAARLREMCRAHVRVVTSDLEHASVFLQEWKFLGEPRREEIARRRDAYEAYFRGVIEEGVASGEFRPVDPPIAAAWILSALNGIAQWYRPDGRLTADEIAHQYADLFATALGCTTTSPTAAVPNLASDPGSGDPSRDGLRGRDSRSSGHSPRPQPSRPPNRTRRSRA
jgi:AcrR family transcriptional regulator